LNNKDYQPISCDYYDLLESAATRRAVVELCYFSKGSEKTTTKETIVDFVIREKQEFMVLASGQEIRLDKLYSIDGQVSPTHSGEGGACHI